MIELTVLTILTILVVLTLRHVKPPVLEHPLVIQRVGQYHITLAPQLNGAQTFMEHIAKQFATYQPVSGECDTQFFSVKDFQLFGDKDKFYLLAVSLRNGLLYFQVIAPPPLLRDKDSHLDAMRTFSAAVLVGQPANTNNDAAAVVMQAIDTAAQNLNITVESLTV
ncbi:MAG: hypothetical protein PHU06_04070 [Gallionella sp.]|nr:hypothetical protein [Gallionella sp.]MDD4958688.1 hypothetical protein [Gallionella sp.]